MPKRKTPRPNSRCRLREVDVPPNQQNPRHPSLFREILPCPALFTRGPIPRHRHHLRNRENPRPGKADSHSMTSGIYRPGELWSGLEAIVQPRQYEVVVGQSRPFVDGILANLGLDSIDPL